MSGDVEQKRPDIVVEVHTVGDPPAVRLELTGEIDQLNADDFVAVAQAWMRPGVASLTLDLAGVVFIDSGGIGRIIHLWKQGRSLGVPVRLTAAHEAVLALLELAGLGRFIDIEVVAPRPPLD